MIKLSPSDFAYLYEECKLCYCLKVKNGIYQPSMPMPGVFSTINSILQGNLVGKDLRTLSDILPEGIVESQEGYVHSKAVPGTNTYIKGKYDLLIKRPEGDYILVDFKISKADPEKIDKYKTQLNAYKYALENPENGEGVTISRLGLIIMYPTDVTFADQKALVNFPPEWMEVPVDTDGFLGFMKEASELLSGPRPPESKDCKWCKYRHLGEELAHGEISEKALF